LCPYPREKGPGGGGVAAACLPVRTAAACAGLHQPADCLAWTCAAGLALGWRAAPRPRVCERAPRRERRFVATQPQGLARCGTAQSRWPRRGAPRVAFVCITMRGDAGRFLTATASGLQARGDGEDIVADTEAVVHPLREHGRAPAGAATSGRDWPLVTAGSACGCLRRGACGRAPGGLLARCARDAIATAHASPGGDGLLVHASAPSDLRATLAVEDRAEGEERRALAQGAQGLGRLPLACHCFTISGRQGKTHAAQRDVPPPMRLAPRWQACPRCVASRQSIFRKSFS
jgi:hypothetical protein